MEKLSVFISWSDKRSFLVAEGLARLLPRVLSNVEVLWSAEIGTGKEWFAEINRMLKQADFVILCLTPENMKETWINYEAGAVFGKTEKTTKVCPYLIKTRPNFSRSALPAPLAYFNGVMADRSGTLKLVSDINKATSKPLPKPELEKRFNKEWRAFKRVLDKAVAMQPPEPPPPPPPPPPRIDPAEDFLKVSRDIACHRDRLLGKFLNLIDQTINDCLSRTYSATKSFDAAYEEIKNSEAWYENSESVLVGNVRKFFIKHFNKGNLKKVIKLMDADIRSAPDPVKMREKLTTRMKDVLDKVFSRYQVILANKLDAYLNKNR